MEQKLFTQVNVDTAEGLKVLFDNLCNKEYTNLLDVGCGRDPKLIKDIKAKERWGIEIFEPAFDEIKSKKFYDIHIFGDVRTVLRGIGDNRFDLVTGIDLIEHFDKQIGIDVLKELDRVAKKEILLFTPYKFYHQDAYEGNPYQEHKSGWDENDFPGFDVYLLPKMHGTGAMVLHKVKGV